LGTWPSYLADLLSLRLVGAVGARINVTSSHSQCGPAMACIRSHVLTIASPDLLTSELSLCSPSLFVDLIDNASCDEDRQHNIQCVIDSLSMDVLHTSLSHISAADIMKRKRSSLINLLDIFHGLLEYILDGIAKDTDGESPSPHTCVSPHHVYVYKKWYRLVEWPLTSRSAYKLPTILGHQITPSPYPVMAGFHLVILAMTFLMYVVILLNCHMAQSDHHFKLFAWTGRFTALYTNHHFHCRIRSRWSETCQVMSQRKRWVLENTNLNSTLVEYLYYQRDIIIQCAPLCWQGAHCTDSQHIVILSWELPSSSIHNAVQLSLFTVNSRWQHGGQ